MKQFVSQSAICWSWLSKLLMSTSIKIENQSSRPLEAPAEMQQALFLLGVGSDCEEWLLWENVGKQNFNYSNESFWRRYWKCGIRVVFSKNSFWLPALRSFITSWTIQCVVERMIRHMEEAKEGFRRRREQRIVRGFPARFLKIDLTNLKKGRNTVLLYDTI